MAVIIYLCNALGFFIQLAPCALMIFIPFPQSACRCPKKRILWGTALGTLVLAAIFPLIVMSFPDLLFLANAVMLLVIVLLLICQILLVQEQLIKKVLVFFIVLFYAVSQFLLVNATRLILPGELFLNYGPYSPVGMFLYAVTTAVLLPAMLIYVIRPMGRFIQEMAFREMQREFLIAIFSTILFVTAVMYVDNQEYIADYYHNIILLEVLLILEQIMIYSLIFRESLRRQRDSERRRALEIQRLQYSKISHEMENARQLRHDLRHHLNTLGALNAQGRQEEIAAYLKEYGAGVDWLSRLKFSGDPVVDGVLEYYMSRLEELSVSVNYEVSLDASGSVNDIDMTVLLGNLLENALEALQKLPEKKREMSIELRTVRTMILLRIRNSCEESGGSVEPENWKAFVDQNGGEDSGVGLSSVASIAEKYHGSALFQRGGGVFTARVILNPGHEQ